MPWLFLPEAGGNEMNISLKKGVLKEASINHALISFLVIGIVSFLPGYAWAIRPLSLLEGQAFSGSRGERLQNPQSITFDRYRNLLLVADTDGQRVMVYNPEGRLLLTLGERGGVGLPYGIAVDREGTLYVSGKASGKIVALPNYSESMEKGIKSLYKDFPLTKGGEEVHVKAGRVYTGDDGLLYIVDRALPRVVVADRKGHIKFSFGSKGFGPGQFIAPTALTFDGTGRIFVSDGGARRMLVFSPKGKYLYQLGRDLTRSQGVDRFDGIATGQHHNLFMVEPNRGEIQVMDINGNRIFTFPEKGSLAGRLFFPVDLTFDATGRLFLLERGTGLVKTFTVRY